MVVVCPSVMTVKKANRMNTGTTVTVSGGTNVLGHCNGTFVVEKIPSGFFLVSKLPNGISAATARVMINARRHKYLLLVGEQVFSGPDRKRIPRLTRRMVNTADPKMIRIDADRVELTNRGVGCFEPHDELVFSVPSSMVSEIERMVEYALDRHHIGS